MRSTGTAGPQRGPRKSAITSGARIVTPVISGNAKNAIAAEERR